MYLHARRAFRRVVLSDLIAADNLTSSVVELVMIDLERGQCGIEGELDVRRPRRELEGRHADGGGPG